jgi:endonuclease IV
MSMDNSEQIAALRAAIATGARRVVFHSGGTRREVEYHSLKDMREALTALEQQQNPRPAMTFGAFRMGWR